MNRFLFRHITEDDGIMHYAESVGILTPERKVGSTEAFVFGSKNSYLRRGSAGVYNNSSQVGLSFDSPTSSRYDLKSMVSTEDTTTSVGSGGDLLQQEYPISPPSPRHSILIPMHRSPSRNRKSVHFGLHTDETAPSVEEISNIGDHSLSYSSNHLDSSVSSCDANGKSRE